MGISEVLKVVLPCVGITALVIAGFVASYFLNKRHDKAKSGRAYFDALQAAEKLGCTFSTNVPESISGYVGAIHKAVASMEGAALSSKWPQSAQNFLTGVRDGVGFAAFDYTYYVGNSRRSHGNLPAVELSAVFLLYPQIRVPEFNLVHDNLHVFFTDDLKRFFTATKPDGVLGQYSFRMPEPERIWPIFTVDLVRRFASDNIFFCCGRSSMICFMFEKPSLEDVGAQTRQAHLNTAFMAGALLRAEMERVGGFRR